MSEPASAATLAFDHVVVAVRDLASVPHAAIGGGAHPGWGTANRIVPLGDGYIEYLAVIDAQDAAASPIGSWIASLTADGDRLAALALRTDDIDGVAARIGSHVVPGTRTRPDGVELRWRLTGIERAMGGVFPFFIAWDVPSELHPGFGGEGGIAWAELSGEADALRAWIGPCSLDLRIVDGPAALRAVGLADGSVLR